MRVPYWDSYTSILIYTATLISDGLLNPTLYCIASDNTELLTQRVGTLRHHWLSRHRTMQYLLFVKWNIKPPTGHILMGPQNAQCGILHHLWDRLSFSTPSPRSLYIQEGNTISHGTGWLLPDRSHLWRLVTARHLALSYSTARLCSVT